jgi:hypothetical protein
MATEATKSSKLLKREGGKFVSPYKEPRGRSIAIRLPASLDQEFFDHVGDRPYRPIIEQAIREYLERQS